MLHAAVGVVLGSLINSIREQKRYLHLSCKTQTRNISVSTTVFC